MSKHHIDVVIEELESKTAPSAAVALIDRKLSTVEELEDKTAPCGLWALCD